LKWRLSDSAKILSERAKNLTMEATVIIITLERPDYLRRCLGHLAAQTRPPLEIIVVDASKGDATARMLARDFPDVIYLSSAHALGNMPMSRNIGLKASHGDIIAFIDDDAFVEPQWMEQLTASYEEDGVGAVGGRAMNGQAGEATRGVDEIGQIRRDGLITQNFAADPGKVIDVDIIIGCNMSFRRDVLARLGGFREHYSGISGSCEDTDICVRVKKLGFRIRFNPAACVEHIGAPQFTGQRFDRKYDMFGYRNYLMLLIINYGIFSGFFFRAVGYLLFGAVLDFAKRVGGACLSAVYRLAGLCMGICLGVSRRMKYGGGPERRDAAGEEIRRSLSGTPVRMAQVQAAEGLLETATPK